MLVWNLLLSSILVPLVAIALLWRKARAPVGPWLATVFMAGGLAGFSFFTAPWGTFGMPIRWAVAVLFAGACVRSWFRRADPPPTAESPMRIVVKLAIGFFFGGVAIGVLRGHEVPPRPLDVGFPLRGGTFLVLHGGSTPASNIHFQDPAQRYAVDFVELNAAGMRASGIAPAALAQYEIFGAQVVSPCDGVVETASDGAPDGAAQSTAGGPPPNPLGNHVIVRCSDGTAVTLAHLQRGSVQAKQGAAMTRGVALARAGHSGASPEPHLHIHAERDGRAVPLTFEGRWMVRNQSRNTEHGARNN